jgi:pSer/pThr/pTyr-binding forkhead associated (FHA) protein
MVFLITDAEEAKLLSCPAVIRIGRGVDNNIRPDSQSASKHHAIIHTNFIAGTTKVEVKIEDLQSRNGTFMGPSPLEMEKVNGTKLVLPGSYIRFGHSQKYFRIVDTIDGNEDEILRVSGISPSNNVKAMMSPSHQQPSSSGVTARTSIAAMGLHGPISGRHQPQQIPHRSESPLFYSGKQVGSVDNQVVAMGSPSSHNNMQPFSELISDRAEHATSFLSFQAFNKSKHQTLSNYAKYLQSFHDQLSSIFQQATQSTTNEFNQATNMKNGKSLKDFFEKDYDVDKIESELEEIRKALIKNKDTILIIYLSMNTMEVDISTTLQILDLTLSIIGTFATKFMNNKESVVSDDNDTHFHEINAAVLRETQDMLSNVLVVFNQSRINPLVEQVEQLLSNHFKSPKFSSHSLNENLEMLRDAMVRCTAASLVSNQKFFDMSKIIVSSLCPFLTILSIEYIALLHMNEVCFEELQSSANRKAVGPNATLQKIRRIASMRDSSQLKASIDDFRKEEMEMMGKRHRR